MHHEPGNLGSLILNRIIPKERTLYTCNISNFKCPFALLLQAHRRF